MKVSRRPSPARGTRPLGPTCVTFGRLLRSVRLASIGTSRSGRRWSGSRGCRRPRCPHRSARSGPGRRPRGVARYSSRVGAGVSGAAVRWPAVVHREIVGNAAPDAFPALVRVGDGDRVVRNSARVVVEPVPRAEAVEAAAVDCQVDAAEDREIARVVMLVRVEVRARR